jgi:hypothetical protein
MRNSIRAPGNLGITQQRLACLLWMAPWAALLGCGSPAVVEEPAPQPPVVAVEADDLPPDDLPDAAHQFALPAGEHDEAIQFLAASVEGAKPNYKLPYLATCRIEQGGSVTTGSVVHCSPKFGTHILSCRHGRDKGGEWVARMSSGAMIYGKKYVLSKDSDLCLLVAPGQYDLGYVRPVPLRMAALPNAEPCLSIGYDRPLGGDKFSNQAGEAPRAWTEAQPMGNFRTSADGYPLISAMVPSGPGRSGGGLFVVSSSELIGVCSFRDAFGVHFVGRKSLLTFLNRLEGLGHVRWWKPLEIPPPKIETATVETPKADPSKAKTLPE